MAYATQQDIIDAYSEDELAITAPDENGDIDATTVARAIERATNLINSSLSARYDLPPTLDEPLLKDLAVDIAMYYAAGNVVGGSEEKRLRFEDAQKVLADVRTGKRILRLHPAEDDGLGEDNQDAYIESSPRLFKRSYLTDIL